MKENTEDLNKKYWNGGLNKAYRYWFYLNRGLEIFNQFKYLFAFFLGVYFALKLKGIIWLIGMTVLSLPILMIIGYWSAHHFAKVLDWLNVKFSTHYGKYNFELMEDQLKELKEINEKINKKIN